MRDEGAVRALLATGKCNLLAVDTGGSTALDYGAWRRAEDITRIVQPWEEVSRARAAYRYGAMVPYEERRAPSRPVLRLLLERGIDAAGRAHVHHGCVVRLRDMVRLQLLPEHAGWDGLVAASVGVAGWRRRRAAVVAAAADLLV
jgi:hypothetical protein